MKPIYCITKFLMVMNEITKWYADTGKICISNHFFVFSFRLLSLVCQVCFFVCTVMYRRYSNAYASYAFKKKMIKPLCFCFLLCFAFLPFGCCWNRDQNACWHDILIYKYKTNRISMWDVSDVCYYQYLTGNLHHY